MSRFGETFASMISFYKSGASVQLLGPVAALFEGSSGLF